MTNLTGKAVRGLRVGVSAPRSMLEQGFSLPIHAATPDHTTGICIWQGESVKAVKELVESVVGPYSDINWCTTPGQRHLSLNGHDLTS